MGDKAVGGPKAARMNPRGRVMICCILTYQEVILKESDRQTVDITRIMVLAGIWVVVDSPGVAHCPRDIAEPPIFHMRE